MKRGFAIAEIAAIAMLIYQVKTITKTINLYVQPAMVRAVLDVRKTKNEIIRNNK